MARVSGVCRLPGAGIRTDYSFISAKQRRFLSPPLFTSADQYGRSPCFGPGTRGRQARPEYACQLYPSMVSIRWLYLGIFKRPNVGKTQVNGCVPSVCSKGRGCAAGKACMYFHLDHAHVFGSPTPLTFTGNKIPVDRFSMCQSCPGPRYPRGKLAIAPHVFHYHVLSPCNTHIPRNA